MGMKQLNFKLPASELALLDKYAQSVSRTRTELLREFIRSLEGKKD
jgi:hypothetical protein